MSLTIAERVIPEGTTATYTATLQDEAGQPVALASLTSLTLTYYNVADGSIINSRNAQDVKNANNVTVHATNGLVTWELQAADTVIVDSTIATGRREQHKALFTWTWASGAKVGRHEVLIEIKQLAKVS